MNYKNAFMPHCLLEYSANVLDEVDPQGLFLRLHRELKEIQAFSTDDIKSRAWRHTDYFVGDGAPQNAFVFLRFSLLSGRDISVRQRVGQACVKVLTEAFAKSLASQTCQFSVEVVEMDRSVYTKFPLAAPAASP